MPDFSHNDSYDNRDVKKELTYNLLIYFWAHYFDLTKLTGWSDSKVPFE